MGQLCAWAVKGGSGPIPNQCSQQRPPLCLTRLRGFGWAGRHSEKNEAEIRSHALLTREGLGACGHRRRWEMEAGSVNRKKG